MSNIANETLLQLAQKGYVLFAPKSAYGLKNDYPELKSAKEFEGFNDGDMLFIWAYACASSPFVTIADRHERMSICVEYAYPKKVRADKLKEYEVRFDGAMNQAIEKMAAYRLDMRVQEYMALKVARENYMSVMLKNISKATPAEQQDWLKNSKLAQEGLAEQRKQKEGLNFGLEEGQDTMISDAIDLLSMYHERGSK